MTRKLRRRPNDPVPIPDKRRKPAPDILYSNVFHFSHPKTVRQPFQSENAPCQILNITTSYYYITLLRCIQELIVTSIALSH